MIACICQPLNCSPILNSGLTPLGMSQLNRRRSTAAPATTPRRFSRARRVALWSMRKLYLEDGKGTGARQIVLERHFPEM
jgi:hypothetical protein